MKAYPTLIYIIMYDYNYMALYSWYSKGGLISTTAGPQDLLELGSSLVSREAAVVMPDSSITAIQRKAHATYNVFHHLFRPIKW